MKNAVIDNNIIKISFKFPYGSSEFNSVLHNVKTIPGRKWNSDRKIWTAPYTEIAIKKLKEMEFEIEGNITIEEKKEIKEIKFPKNSPLFSFQKEGVQFLHRNNGRGLIGDEMGTGKTIQAATYIKINKEFPVLIICPASLKLNWQKEIKKWTGFDSYIISGKQEDGNIFNQKILIINYDIIDAHITNILKANLKLVVLDEFHKIKNPKAKRTQAIKKLKKVKKIIGLSGTPILNKPIELFNMINMIDPVMFNSRWNFAKRYCDLKHNGFGYDFSGASNTEELHDLLSTKYMIRRTKEQVLKDLPPKLISITPLEITNRKEYQEAEKNFFDWLCKKEGTEKAIKSSGNEQLVQVEKLKQLAVEGKMKAVFNWIDDVLENKDKLVLFFTHKKTIEAVQKKYGDICVKIDGSVKNEDRQKAVDEFQNNSEIKIFLGNIKAASEGITLTAADTLAFIELGWTPGEHDQASDRIHRIGAIGDSVNIHYLVATDTIEEEIAEMIDKKRKVIDSVVDGKQTKEQNLLSELIQKRLKTI